MTQSSLWLVGAGGIALDYARVLTALGQSFEVVGRGNKSAIQFEYAMKRPVKRGGIDAVLHGNVAPDSAIVAVGIENLTTTAISLVKAGTKRILLEKPGGLKPDEIQLLQRTTYASNAEVLIAYNRRFYGSVQQAQRFIAEDEGILSLRFDFTEWSEAIRSSPQPQSIKNSWLIANSSHVIDLAFYLAGKPLNWKSWHAGSLDWHPSAARFCGAGITEKGVLFSYISDWQAPGRWGIELFTSKHRLILRPMEHLQIMRLSSLCIEKVDPIDEYDSTFKPGLFKQVRAFLSLDHSKFCTLSEQAENLKVYSCMAGYQH